MSLFLVRSTLRAGWAVGLSIGAGIALVDALYAACGALGAASLLSIDALRTTFALLGAAVLLLLGARTLRDALRVRVAAEAGVPVASSRRAFATSASGASAGSRCSPAVPLPPGARSAHARYGSPTWWPARG
jgi:threonine/homoserine/homoserine lactone efflux protein